MNMHGAWKAGAGTKDDNSLIDMMSMIIHADRGSEAGKVYLNLCKSLGLRTHAQYQTHSDYSKYGKWSYLDYMGQPPSESPRYSFTVDWAAEQPSIREIDDPAGAVPSFVTDWRLPPYSAGQYYEVNIATTGGDGARTVSYIGGPLPEGLTCQITPGGARISGTPTTNSSIPRSRRFMLRVLDQDNDPAWRVFYFTQYTDHYNLINKATGRYLDAQTAGPYGVSVQTPDGSQDQQWFLISFAGRLKIFQRSTVRLLKNEEPVTDTKPDDTDPANPDIYKSEQWAMSDSGETGYYVITNLSDNSRLTAETSGTYSVSSAARDNSDAQKWSLVLAAPNGAPAFILDPFARTVAFVGQVYSGAIADAASDPDAADALAYSKVSGPAWLTVAANGALSGIPGAGDLGVNSFTIRVTDPVGHWDEAVMRIAVIASGQTVTFYSTATEDGYVIESSETSNVGGSKSNTSVSNSALRAGDNMNDCQTKVIVSFDTSSIPDDAFIASVVLRLKCGVYSDEAFSTFGPCYVDIKAGSGFYNNTALEKQDFEATADATQVAVMSDPVATGNWSAGELASGLSYVNKTGKTQLRVYFPLDDNDDANGDYFGAYSGEAAAGDRPELVVIYQSGNIPPAFNADPISKPNATQGQSYGGSIAGDAWDPNPGDILTFSKVSGPAWLAVAANGALSGTPGPGDTGLQQFRVRVIDGAGYSVEATLNIWVRSPESSACRWTLY